MPPNRQEIKSMNRLKNVENKKENKRDEIQKTFT